MKQPPFIVGFVVVVLTLLIGVGLLWQQVRRQTSKDARRWHMRECPTMLKAAFVAQKAYFQERDRYGDDFESIGFTAERGNHGVYVLRRDGPVAMRTTEVLPPTKGSTVIGVDEFMWASHSTAKLLAQLPATFTGGVAEGVRGECPSACAVVMACVTEFAGEPGVTTWSIATFERVTAAGERVEAGQPVAEPR